LSLVMLRLASRVNGLTGIAVTKLDVLDSLKALKVCTAYTFADERIEEFPADMRLLSKVKPVYEEFDGWPNITDEEWAALAKKGFGALPEEWKTEPDRLPK